MKNILIIAVIIILALSAGILYLNEKVLPVKIKAIIIKDLESATQKKVLLGSVRFSIFRGLVLRDLIIRDDLNAIVNVKEASCAVFILPVFKKQIIIPRLTLESPEIFLERKADNSFNVLGLFAGYHEAKTDFNFILRKIVIKNGDVNFHDLTLEPGFAKEFKGLDADISLDLPAKVRFGLKFMIQSDAPMALSVSGEYLLAAKELTADIKMKGLALKEFAQYYEKGGFYFPGGRIDSSVNLKYKNDIISADIESETKALEFSKEKLLIGLDSNIRSSLRYNTADKKISYSGTAEILNSDISGIETIEKISSVKGHVEFSNLGLASNDIQAMIFEMPVDAKMNINDFNNPVLDIDAVSDIRLASFQNTLRDKFKIDIPADLAGPAKLRLEIQYKFTTPPDLQIKGSLDVVDASVELKQAKEIFDKVNGTIRFTPNQLSWSDTAFRYKDIDYRSSGTLTNFKTPGVQMKLSSENLALDTVFAMNGKLFNFSKFSGRYLNSTFLLNGSLDFSDPEKMGAIYAEMTGVINLDPEDLKENVFKKAKEKFDKIKPKGDIRLELAMKGNIKDLKTCAMDAKLSSENLSIYDLKLQNSTMNYSQKNGVGDILFMRSFLYDGSMSMTGKIDWAAKDTPYSVNANIEGVKIEKFKADASFKDKDISGLVNVQLKMNGFANNISRLRGRGTINVSQGKLWQLNLFRGLGVLLFTSDFSNVIFREGHGELAIEDSAVFVDNFGLKSELLDLYGSMRLGFDKSVSGSVKAEFSDEALDTTAQKNIVTALGKYSMIQLSGTLKDPQYKVKPDVGSIIEDVAERFFNQ